MNTKEMYYTSYIQRERHAIVDRAVEECLDSLRIPQIAKRLGSYATDIAALLEKVVVPNVHHGEVQDHAMSDTRVVAVPIHPGEKVWVHARNLRFNALQREVIFQQYDLENAQSLIEQYDNYSRTVPHGLVLPAPSNQSQAAYVAHDRAVFEMLGGDDILRTSPLFVLDASRPGYRTPFVVAHEMTHALQLNHGPVVRAGVDLDQRDVEYELEAHYVGHELIEGYKDAGLYSELLQRTNDDELMMIPVMFERIRKEYLESEDAPFRANKAMVAELRRRHLV